MRRFLHHNAAYIALAIGVVVFPLVLRNHYFQMVGALVGIYSIIVLGLCLLLGYAGQVSLGHAAFFGIGAYATAVLSTRCNLDPWLGMLAGLVLACLIAWGVGRPTLRLHGHYLAMATLGFGVIVQVVLHEAREITGGFGGIASIPSLRVGSFEFTGDLRNFYLIWTAVFGCLILSANVVNSRVGRALRAIHDSEVAALACGVDVPRYKVKVFVLSAGFAAISGSLYASYLSFISPEPFGLALSVQFVVMVVVGGSRNVWGALLGVALMTALGQQIERTEAIKEYNTVVYGLVLVLFILFMPDGLVEVLRRAGAAVGRRFARRGASG